MRNTILLSGYFQENLGDDLFFKIVTERYPNVNFFTYSCIGFYSQTYHKENISVPKYVKLLNPLFSFLFHCLKNRKLYGFVYRIVCIIEKHVKRVDLTNFAGELCLCGSCFMEKNVFNCEPLDVSKIEFSNKYSVNSSNRFLCGANVGPVFYESYLSEICNIIQEYHDVCFRDKSSYNLYSFMSNVRYAPDIVFNMDISSYKSVSVEKQIIVNLIDLENKLGIANCIDKYANLVNVLRTYISKNYHIKLVSFCKLEKDEYILNKVRRKLPKGCSTIISYNGTNHETILKEFAASEYVICGRFHSMILAMLFNKPFFAICYDDKMNNYLSDLCYLGNKTDIRSLNKIDFDYINYNLDKNLTVDVSEQIKNAPNQFLKFEEFLNN